MNIFKKILVPSNEKLELTVYEKWSVRWTGRYGEYCGDTRTECEIFTSEEDAKIFAQILKDAFKLIRHIGDHTISIEKI